MRILTLLAISALSLSAAAPAMAQDAMASHDMMMKNAGCMKMHPDMMQRDDMMGH